VTPIRAITQILSDHVPDIGTIGVNIFMGTSPDLPPPSPVQSIVTVVETGGRSPIVLHSEPGQLLLPNFQITTRHTKYVTARDSMELVRDAMNKANFVVADRFFLWVRPLQEPVGLPSDPAGSVRIALNVTTCVR
jgi:hypothetical protein